MTICKKCSKKEQCNYKKIKAISRTQLQNQIENTLQELYSHEYFLIENHVHEIAIVSHFLRYFINEHQKSYCGLNMDMEYNKKGVDSKYYYCILGKEYHKARPDFIIHKRGCNAHNVLYVEFKLSNNQENLSRDYQKICAFTEKNDDINVYHYKYGLSIILYLDKVEMQWFKDGRKLRNGKRIWKYNK